jgi:uncharacterized membrane protein
MSVLEKLVKIIPYIETEVGLIAFIVLAAFAALIFIKKKSNKNSIFSFGIGNNVEKNSQTINESDDK